MRVVILYILALVALVAAFGVACASTLRRAAQALGVASLAAGGLCVDIGATYAGLVLVCLHLGAVASLTAATLAGWAHVPVPRWRVRDVAWAKVVGVAAVGLVAGVGSWATCSQAPAPAQHALDGGAKPVGRLLLSEATLAWQAVGPMLVVAVLAACRIGQSASGRRRTPP